MDKELIIVEKPDKEEQNSNSDEEIPQDQEVFIEGPVEGDFSPKEALENDEFRSEKETEEDRVNRI